MRNQILQGISGASLAGENVVIIDVFRAVPTAISILQKNPRKYWMTSSEKNIISSSPETIRIGKPFMGSDVRYDAPNSPSIVSKLDLLGKDIIHRTAGCGGCLDALKNPKIILLCSFSNIEITSKFIQSHGGNWDIVAAGHQGLSPVEEDNYCARVLLNGNPQSNFDKRTNDLRYIGSAKFFQKGCNEYPLDDLDLCLDSRQNSHLIIAKSSGGMWYLQNSQKST